MRLRLGTKRTRGLMICLVVTCASACAIAQVAPVSQIVEVTQVVPVTQVVQVSQIVEVTQVVPAMRTVEVLVEVPEKTVEVTRVVVETVIVEVLVEEPKESSQATPVPVPGTPIADDILLVWYDFEGDLLTSRIVTDRSDNGYDAQVNGTVNIANGLSSGQAILFSGNGFIQAESNPAAGRNAVSFSLWFKTDHPQDNYKLASAAWWSGGPGSGWILATHIPEFWSDDTHSLYTPGIFNNENHFPAGEWVHEVITYAGNRIREYTNGQLVNDWPTTGAAIGLGQAMVIGAWPSFSAYDFKGSLDEFRLFGWALTPQEIQEIYSQH